MNNNGSFESSEVFIFTKDHLGSIRELSDLQQNPIQRYNYSAYGRTRIEKLNANSEKLVVNPYAYTSRELDETGDYFYRARYYDAWNGRFLSLDPIGFAGGDESLYRYVRNKPVYTSDPFGFYGTSSCAYYSQACSVDGGPYECGLAQKACAPNSFTNNNIGQCIRQCLQEEHKKRAGDQNYCGNGGFDQGGPGFGGTRASTAFYSDHASCFAGCAANSENPYNWQGPDLPDNSPSIY